MTYQLFVLADDDAPPLPWRPAADVYRTHYGWLVKFELAGVRPDDVRIEARDRTLRVHGVRRDLIAEERSCGQYQLEIAYSRFEREVELPIELQNAEIAVELQQGMLLVRIQEENL